MFSSIEKKVIFKSTQWGVAASANCVNDVNSAAETANLVTLLVTPTTAKVATSTVGSYILIRSCIFVSDLETTEIIPDVQCLKCANINSGSVTRTIKFETCLCIIRNLYWNGKRLQVSTNKSCKTFMGFFTSALIHAISKAKNQQTSNSGTYIYRSQQVPTQIFAFGMPLYINYASYLIMYPGPIFLFT